MSAPVPLVLIYVYYNQDRSVLFFWHMGGRLIGMTAFIHAVRLRLTCVTIIPVKPRTRAICFPHSAMMSPRSSLLLASNNNEQRTTNNMKMMIHLNFWPTITAQQRQCNVICPATTSGWRAITSPLATLSLVQNNINNKN